MAGKKLVVVHGMGQHDDASLKKEVVDAFTTAFGFYDALKGQAVGSLVEIVPVSYNSFFDDYRKKLEERSGALGDRLAAIDTSVPFTLEVVQKINGLEASLGRDT